MKVKGDELTIYLPEPANPIETIISCIENGQVGKLEKDYVRNRLIRGEIRAILRPLVYSKAEKEDVIRELREFDEEADRQLAENEDEPYLLFI